MTTPSPVAPPKRPAARAELAAAIFFFVAMVALAVTLVRQRLDAKPPGPVDPLAGTVLVPSAAAEGVTVTPGRGRLLLVESTPAGAKLTLDGSSLGETPFSSDFTCSPDTQAVLEVTRAGYQPVRYTLACVDGSTRVVTTLKRAR